MADDGTADGAWLRRMIEAMALAGAEWEASHTPRPTDASWILARAEEIAAQVLGHDDAE